MSTPTTDDLAYIAAIRKREKALARAILPRIAFLVRRQHPDAVSIHTTWSSQQHGPVPDKILGPHGRVLWTRDNVLDAEIVREARRYVDLRPTALRLRADRIGGHIIRLPKARP